LATFEWRSRFFANAHVIAQLLSDIEHAARLAYAFAIAIFPASIDNSARTSFFAGRSVPF
jgi:hypothetical protein